MPNTKETQKEKMIFNFISKAENSMEGLNAIAVIPSKEEVDYNKIYVYSNEIPEFGMFEEETFKYKESHSKDLGKAMLSGEWIGPVMIAVDVNTHCVSEHNHTYGGYIWARMNGWKEPLYVRYENVPTSKEDRLKAIIKDEWTKKFDPKDILKVFMAKPGEKPNVANKVYDYCMGHPYLRGTGDSKYDLSTALQVLFGESKPYTKQLKKGRMFNIRNTKVDWNSYDVLDKALAVRMAIHIDKPAGKECFFRKWYDFYEGAKNYSYLNCGGWEKYLEAAPRVAEAMGGFQPCQDDKYNAKFFDCVLSVAKGVKSLESVREDFGVKVVA